MSGLCKVLAFHNLKHHIKHVLYFFLQSLPRPSTVYLYIEHEVDIRRHVKYSIKIPHTLVKTAYLRGENPIEISASLLNLGLNNFMLGVLSAFV